jgi:hypothetical protein
MRRRPTIHELVWPKDSSFDAVSSWPTEFGVQVLNRVWKAFDRLSEDVLKSVHDWTNLEHVERSLTDLHYDKIVELQTGEEPFLPTREVPDFESRQSSRAMPRSNDFGFKIRGGDFSLVWPLEAKVIAGLDRVASYIADLNGKYLACRSSPFSPEAGLIGYLLGLDVDGVFESISKQINQNPVALSEFSMRQHRVSDHVRSVPEGKPYPSKFRCHHLLMQLRSDAIGPAA